MVTLNYLTLYLPVVSFIHLSSNTNLVNDAPSGGVFVNYVIMDSSNTLFVGVCVRVHWLGGPNVVLAICSKCYCR